MEIFIACIRAAIRNDPLEEFMSEKPLTIVSASKDCDEMAYYLFVEELPGLPTPPGLPVYSDSIRWSDVLIVGGASKRMRLLNERKALDCYPVRLPLFEPDAEDE